MCGVVGIASKGEAIGDLRAAAHKLQHRSHMSAGAVTFDAPRALPHIQRGIGRLTEVFTAERLEQLSGTIGLAHVRWPTAGEPTEANIHPLSGTFQGKPFFIVHNGEISCRGELDRQFSTYQPEVTSDTKFFLALIEDSKEDAFLDALQYALSIVKGTYSLILLYDNTLYAVRDVTGNRPLYLGQREDAVCVVSENFAFRVLNIPRHQTREIKPGEIVVIHGEDLSVEQGNTINAAPPEIPRVLMPCMIELVYSMHPSSVFCGRTIKAIRERMGWQLAQTYRPDADIVVGIPDSGVDAGKGFADGSGIPYTQAVVRYHQSGRIFYYGLDERDDFYRFKYDPVEEELNGKRVVLVDDTMFAGDTIKNVMEVCAEAGAIEFHVAIPAPMITTSCYYGTPTSQEHRRLIARDHDGIPDQIREEIGSACGGRLKSLAFLSVQEARQAFVSTRTATPGYEDLTTANACDACFFGGTRHIPVDVDGN